MVITKKPCIHAALIILLFSLFVSASSQTTGQAPRSPTSFDNTVVVLSSDNATHGLGGAAGLGGGSNGPCRGNFFYTPLRALGGIAGDESRVR